MYVCGAGMSVKVSIPVHTYVLAKERHRVPSLINFYPIASKQSLTQKLAISTRLTIKVLGSIYVLSPVQNDKHTQVYLAVLQVLRI